MPCSMTCSSVCICPGSLSAMQVLNSEAAESIVAAVSKVGSQAYQKASLADGISNRAWHWCQQHCIKPAGVMLDNCWEASQVETLCGLASSRVGTLHQQLRSTAWSHWVQQLPAMKHLHWQVSQQGLAVAAAIQNSRSCQQLLNIVQWSARQAEQLAQVLLHLGSIFVVQPGARCLQVVEELLAQLSLPAGGQHWWTEVRAATRTRQQQQDSAAAATTDRLDATEADLGSNGALSAPQAAAATRQVQYASLQESLAGARVSEAEESEPKQALHELSSSEDAGTAWQQGLASGSTVQLPPDEQQAATEEVAATFEHGLDTQKQSVAIDSGAVIAANSVTQTQQMPGVAALHRQQQQAAAAALRTAPLAAQLLPVAADPAHDSQQQFLAELHAAAPSPAQVAEMEQKVEESRQQALWEEQVFQQNAVGRAQVKISFCLCTTTDLA